jgi:HPt (histidine-containing phosphotransfer) domain-containing protein
MKVSELAEGFDLTPEEFLEILELFLQTSLGHLSHMQAAIQERNLPQMLSSAHSLKGAAGNLGLTEIYEIAREMEKKAASQDLVEVWKGMDRVQERLKEMAQTIRREGEKRADD